MVGKRVLVVALPLVGERLIKEIDDFLPVGTNIRGGATGENVAKVFERLSPQEQDRILQSEVVREVLAESKVLEISYWERIKTGVIRLLFKVVF